MLFRYAKMEIIPTKEKNNEKKLTLSFLMFLTLLLSSCGTPNSSSDELPSDNSPSTSEKPSEELSDQSSEPSSSITADEAARYEASLNGSSWKQDHLYIHYLRNDASSYQSWRVWAWQKAPKNLAGTRYDWEEGRDIAGAYVSIDLKSDKYSGAT